MDYLFLMGGVLLALALGMMIVPKILLISYKKRLFDMPDSRKVHQIPVPRLGGISFFSGDTDHLVFYSWCTGLYWISG